MLVINRLTQPSQIKTVVLRKDEVVVTTQDRQKIVFRRVEADDVLLHRNQETNTHGAVDALALREADRAIGER